MATTQQAVIVGVFADRGQAEQAQKELLDSGCSQEQIKTSQENMASGETISSPTASQNELVRDGAIGGGAGALLGTGAAFLARRVNSSLAARPWWLVLLAGAAIGSMLGSMPGLLIGKGMSRGQAAMEQDKASRVLVSIETDNPSAIHDVLQRNGATDVYTTPLPAVREPEASTSTRLPAESEAANEGDAAFGGVQNPPYASALETTQAPSLVVGAFPNQAAANTAIDALLAAGFTSEQIRYSEHGTTGGGILNHLISLGVPSQVAQPYEQEFETGHTVVTVKTADRQQEAQFLLAKHGGYNIKLLKTISDVSY